VHDDILLLLTTLGAGESRGVEKTFGIEAIERAYTTLSEGCQELFPVKQAPLRLADAKCLSKRRGSLG